MDRTVFKEVKFEDLTMPPGYSLREAGLLLYTPAENEFREECRRFAINELAPLAAELHGTKRELEKKDATQEEFRVRIRAGCLKIAGRMAERGYAGLIFPVEYGGSGRSVTDLSIMLEEFSAEAYGGTGFHDNAFFGAVPIWKFGTEEQKERFLKPVIRGELISAIAITEPQAGSDTARIKTRAVKDGDSYVLSGIKRFITNGGIAHFMTLFAVTDPDVHPHDGMSAFIVPTDAPGFSVEKRYDLMGERLVDNSYLSLEDCRLPRHLLLGEEGQGFRIMMNELDVERIIICAGCVGAARKAYEIALEFAVRREQFKRPIYQFEGISFKLAEMYTKIEASRLLTFRASRMVDSGYTASKETAAGRIMASEQCYEVIDEALQILGGIGYTRDYPIQGLLRDTRIQRIGGGSSEIMRFLVAREAVKEVLGEIG